MPKSACREVAQLDSPTNVYFTVRTGNTARCIDTEGNLAAHASKTVMQLGEGIEVSVRYNEWSGKKDAAGNERQEQLGMSTSRHQR